MFRVGRFWKGVFFGRFWPKSRLFRRKWTRNVYSGFLRHTLNTEKTTWAFEKIIVQSFCIVIFHYRSWPLEDEIFCHVFRHEMESAVENS